MVRTAYDADTRQYTFFDTTSNTYYVSAPGEAYGTLVPAATANFPINSRSSGRRITRTYIITPHFSPCPSPQLTAALPKKTTVQAYDRPVFFADDTTVQRRSSPSKGDEGGPPSPPPSSLRRSVTSARKAKRSASFSDILPAHLIASASSPPNSTPPPLSLFPKSVAYARGRGGLKSAPPLSPSRSPSPFEDEKKSPFWSPTDDLPELPPVPPPKTSSPASFSEKEDQHMHKRHDASGGAHLTALRVTTRMLGRTLDAVKGGRRSREGQPNDDGWVVV
jgi:hypothetical protein